MNVGAAMTSIGVSVVIGGGIDKISLARRAAKNRARSVAPQRAQHLINKTPCRLKRLVLLSKTSTASARHHRALPYQHRAFAHIAHLKA